MSLKVGASAHPPITKTGDSNSFANDSTLLWITCVCIVKNTQTCFCGYSISKKIFHDILSIKIKEAMNESYFETNSYN